MSSWWKNVFFIYIYVCTIIEGAVGGFIITFFFQFLFIAYRYKRTRVYAAAVTADKKQQFKTQNFLTKRILIFFFLRVMQAPNVLLNTNITKKLIITIASIFSLLHVFKYMKRNLHVYTFTFTSLQSFCLSLSVWRKIPTFIKINKCRFS